MPQISGKSANFNLIARPYRYLEYLTLGNTLERTRLHYLPSVAQQRHALVLGDGDGRFLAALLAQNSTLQADTVDTSATMLHLLHQRCEAAAPNAARRLRTHHIDALTYTSQTTTDKKYDLVVTNFFIDCLTQPDLEALIARITPTLAPHALWLVSDFRIPPNGLMRLPARIYIRSLYLAFRILTGLRTTQLPDHTAALTHAGLIRTAQHHFLSGLLTTELWQTSQ